MPDRHDFSTLAAGLLVALAAGAADHARAGGEPRVVAPDDPVIEWGPCPGFFPDSCRIGVLNGNAAEPRADVFFKVPAGTAIPPHTHTSAERMVLVSGSMEVEYEGRAPSVIRTGDYAFGPPGHPHRARCLDAGECVLFIAFNEALDAMPAEQP
jgi:quercetin dioxygenase-like cupin family protein